MRTACPVGALPPLTAYAWQKTLPLCFRPANKRPSRPYASIFCSASANQALCLRPSWLHACMHARYVHVFVHLLVKDAVIRLACNSSDLAIIRSVHVLILREEEKCYPHQARKAHLGFKLCFNLLISRLCSIHSPNACLVHIIACKVLLTTVVVRSIAAGWSKLFGVIPCVFCGMRFVCTVYLVPRCCMRFLVLSPCGPALD